MTAPKGKFINMEYQNPGTEKPLILPTLVLVNTPENEIRNNIRINSAKDLEWIKLVKAHDGVAVLVGGGGSVQDEIENIRLLKSKGATIFAMNRASGWCSEHNISVDYQCLLDAKEESRSLVDHTAKQHLIGSQVNPKTMDSIKSPIVWHCNTDSDMEKDFPQERIDAGGYVLLSGGSAVGTSALTMVYALGFRKFHIFGYDSSHTEGKSHVYSQPMNRFIPNVDITWGERTFMTSVTMKSQAEDFQVISQMLQQLDCDFSVYGDGLLQTMYHTKPENLSEREKYQTLWKFENYRKYSPGLESIPTFLSVCEPDNIIIDYGCGSGKASLELARLGYDVFLIDFTDNCRDPDAMLLPFLEWDLTIPIPSRVDYGYCADVMEHIPPDDVDKVLKNIMESAETVFFQISTTKDHYGEAIGTHLHLSVHNHLWWLFKLGDVADVQWNEPQENASLFLVKRKA